MQIPLFPEMPATTAAEGKVTHYIQKIQANPIPEAAPDAGQAVGMAGRGYRFDFQPTPDDKHEKLTDVFVQPGLRPEFIAHYYKLARTAAEAGQLAGQPDIAAETIEQAINRGLAKSYRDPALAVGRIDELIQACQAIDSPLPPVVEYDQDQMRNAAGAVRLV